MPDKHDRYPARSSSKDVADFIDKVRSAPAVSAAGGRGRLMFAMDATASREPTWDRASHLQARMFEETAALGSLDVQLVYYRGYGEFETSPWYRDADALLRRMTAVTCLSGLTQIGRVLQHAIDESRRQRIHALVFIGDCVEEDVDRLGHLAGELGILGVPVFLFHEGHDPVAATAFAHIARLTNGAACRFDANSADQLRELLSAVAVYAVGGHQALEDYSRRAGANVRQLTHQIKR